MSNRKKDRYSAIYIGMASLCFSFGALYASYLNFHVKENCSYGGSKLTWLFGIVCESLGKSGAAWLWLIIGIVAFVVGVILLCGKK
jgi:hypothetical protein